MSPADSHGHTPHSMPSTAGATVIDPVCGMSVDPEHCAGSVEHEGQSYYFCSRHCVQKFQADPQRYLAAKSPVLVQPGTFGGGLSAPTGGVASCPACDRHSEL